jgi:hypothetical protein
MMPIIIKAVKIILRNKPIKDVIIPAIARFKPSRFFEILTIPTIIPIIPVIIEQTKIQQNNKEIIPNTSEVIAALLFFFDN